MFRDGNLAIYKRTRGEKIAGFESIVIRQGKAWEIAGKKIEAAEIYPSTNDFGYSGWFHKTLEAARDKIEELKKKGK